LGGKRFQPLLFFLLGCVENHFRVRHAAQKHQHVQVALPGPEVPAGQ
jgi:hypothetical protein